MQARSKPSAEQSWPFCPALLQLDQQREEMAAQLDEASGRCSELQVSACIPVRGAALFRQSARDPWQALWGQAGSRQCVLLGTERSADAATPGGG